MAGTATDEALCELAADRLEFIRDDSQGTTGLASLSSGGGGEPGSAVRAAVASLGLEAADSATAGESESVLGASPFRLVQAFGDMQSSSYISADAIAAAGWAHMDLLVRCQAHQLVSGLDSVPAHRAGMTWVSSEDIGEQTEAIGDALCQAMKLHGPEGADTLLGAAETYGDIGTSVFVAWLALAALHLCPGEADTATAVSLLIHDD